MSHFNVVNVNARSVKISTTPSKYLTEVRDEACQKFGYTTKDNYTLKFNNKPVLLSQQVRLANLPAGARLELIQASRSPTVISVALQLPNSRLTDKFASNTSLWTILRSFESPGKQNTYNFTDRSVEIKVTSGAGRVYYQMPVITVMPSHKEYSTFVDLQQTLSQLGFDGGSALLKLSFKDTDIPWEEAIMQISQYFKTDEPATAGSQGAHAATSSQQSSVPDPATAAPASSEVVAGQATKNDAPDPEPMEIDSKPAAEPVHTPTQVTTENAATSNIENVSPAAALSAATSSSPAAASSSSPDGADRPRNVQIFSAPTSSTPAAARSGFNENDYQPSIEHAKSHLAALQTRTRNTRLLSDKELAEQEEAHKAKLAAAAAKGGVIRIRMPDGVYIQIPVTKADTAATLYDATRACLEKKHEPFKLNYTGPTGRLVHFPSDSKLLFQDLKFYNNELLTFQWAENASEEARTTRSALASDWAAKAQPLKVQDPSTAANDEASLSGNTGKGGQTVAEGKKKVLSSEEKESKLKNLLGKGLFKKK